MVLCFLSLRPKCAIPLKGFSGVWRNGYRFREAPIRCCSYVTLISPLCPVQQDLWSTRTSTAAWSPYIRRISGTVPSFLAWKYSSICHKQFDHIVIQYSKTILAFATESATAGCTGCYANNVRVQLTINSDKLFSSFGIYFKFSLI